MKNSTEDKISITESLRFIALELYLSIRNRFGQKYIEQLAMNGPHSEQLQLIYVVRAGITMPLRATYGGYFHSLVWLAQHKHRWVRRAVIAQKNFQSNNPTDRWVSEIHSFDSESGTAVILVAELDQPKGARTFTHCNYSWRKWDLIRNTEIEVLQRCRHPKEKYRPV